MVRPAEPLQRVIGLLLIAISLGYLLSFVPRGWVPHDEGMIGQSAERVLRGDTPHVDYEEPYTGGLTLLYAGVFKVAGIDLLNLRWLLFAGAALAQVLMYAILRRYLSPFGAGLGAALSLTWSFPNYFAGLPSWWILICALGCLWAFIRFLETGKLRFAAVAGLSAGVAIIVKQTGVYLLVALVMSLLFEGNLAGHRWPTSRAARAFCIIVAVAALLLAAAILRSRPALSELAYLLLPIAACSGLLITSDMKPRTSGHRDGLAATLTAVAFASVPFALFVVPYILHGQLGQLMQGLLILPQKRLVFAAASMPPANSILLGLPLVALVVMCPPVFQTSTRRGRFLSGGIWAVLSAMLIASLFRSAWYQTVWESSRAFAALIPVAICWRLISGHIHDATQRRILFGVASMLAWASLGQFPFGAPIYFCYVAPLAIVAGAAAAGQCPQPVRWATGAWVALFLVFALVSMNRGYIYNLGRLHELQPLDVNLNFRRAHLRVSPGDAATYHELVALIRTHAGGDGQIIAGPDCPEVYFLTSRVNPSGALFDFFREDESGPHGLTDTTVWTQARVVVLNHEPGFSPSPSSEVVSAFRKEFAEGKRVGRFEVRWH